MKENYIDYWIKDEKDNLYEDREFNGFSKFRKENLDRSNQDNKEKDVEELDMHAILIFILKLQRKNINLENQINLLSKKFNINAYYSKLLIKKVNELDKRYNHHNSFY